MTLGDRIKKYEKISDYHLTPKSCVFIRVDGKSFHTYTRGFGRPFDDTIIDSMNYAASKTAEEMSGVKLAYAQSDECTFMLTDFDNLETQGWFDYSLNKLVSISASMFTAFFNESIRIKMGEYKYPAFFDSRAFVVPKDDAANVFIWRQRDWERNSILMYAQSIFSHRELQNKKVPDIHEMLYSKGLNWANLDPIYKNGSFLKNKELIHEKLDYYGINKLLFEE